MTIITHGFSGNASGWVQQMAGEIAGYDRFPGTNVICYQIRASYGGGFVVTATKLAGGNPTNDLAAEIVIKLDWGDLAGFFNQYDTYEVAEAVAPRLLQPGFIPDLGGRALAELPLHLIGHSRGASLACEISRLLGTNGVWVDHITALDPHPVNEDGNSDPLFVADAPLRVYDNVFFADNYYQTFGGYPSGQSMPNAYNRQLTALPGGYTSAHSDTHLWYHSTIDVSEEAYDSEAYLYATNRAGWFAAYEINGSRAGFHYSRLGGGDRFSADQPLGAGTDRPQRGINRRWDFGVTGAVNRTVLSANNGGWPNVIKMNLAGPSAMRQGQTNAVSIYYQWARPTSSVGTVSIYLDDDSNPYNGNGQLVQELSVPGTTATNVNFATIGFNVATTNTTGVHSVYARITGGGRTRYMYAPETLTVFSSVALPRLSIARAQPNHATINVSAMAGERVVLQGSDDLRHWSPLATNTMTTSHWAYGQQAGSLRRFYRAMLLN